ncbi:hypothetical protein WICPIJ_005273 [Wickerhamomyces pijperi]|uniref:Uncharacterized protein n=1 Tax=Wickerhamomyces pijperi TaxID=599730 RepID=A0A9P8Q6G1_WICPI|nr:hypothetical protein WICPIJ_005273 [Wickerhamomyces pijperi]
MLEVGLQRLLQISLELFLFLGDRQVRDHTNDMGNTLQLQGSDDLFTVFFVDFRSTRQPKDNEIGNLGGIQNGHEIVHVWDDKLQVALELRNLHRRHRDPFDHGGVFLANQRTSIEQSVDNFFGADVIGQWNHSDNLLGTVGPFE